MPAFPHRTWPFAGGEMADRIRAFDWAETRLGPPDAWPQVLRTTVALLLNHGFPMCVLWGAELIAIYNDGYCVLLGEQDSVLLGRPLYDVWPEVRESNEARLRPVWRGETIHLKDALYRKAGQDCFTDAWFDGTVSPLFDDAGDVAGILSTAFETTERVLAQRTLRESEQRYRAYVTASTDIVYRMSPDWREMHQLDGQGVLVDTVEPSEGWRERYIHPDDLPTVEAAIARAIATRGVFELEHRVRQVDGALGWVLSRAVPILDAAGEITEWLGAGSDITDRVLAQAALHDAEARHRAELEGQIAARTAELGASHDLLRATMDASTDMIQVFGAVRDERGRIVDFRWLLNNHTSERVYGDVRGDSLLERNPGVVLEGVFADFCRVVETCEPIQVERHYAHEQFDGWFLQSVVKLADGGWRRPPRTSPNGSRRKRTSFDCATRRRRRAFARARTGSAGWWRDSRRRCGRPTPRGKSSPKARPGFPSPGKDPASRQAMAGSTPFIPTTAPKANNIGGRRSPRDACSMSSTGFATPTKAGAGPMPARRRWSTGRAGSTNGSASTSTCPTGARRKSGCAKARNGFASSRNARPT